jgi:hypothetical protein
LDLDVDLDLDFDVDYVPPGLGIRRALLTRTNAECLYEKERVYDHVQVQVQVQDEVQVHRGKVA